MAFEGIEQFDEIVDRRGTNSYKWEDIPDVGVRKEDVSPLWVADMDFRTAPVVRRAIEARAKHGVFGYSYVPEAYYDAVRNWFGRRYGWTIEREWMQYTSGVVPALSCVLKALVMPGDKVLVTTPVYNCFFSSIRNNGCEVLSSPLKMEDGRYAVDFEDFEKKCADEKTVAFLLCNPHNPGGRVWTREELARIGEICYRHGVVVVSDEIHNELVRFGNKYVPFASVNETNQRCSVVCCSPSKSFNTAGLQIANIICPNPVLRRRIDRAVNINEVCDVNPFGIEATIAAYSQEGAAWLDLLNQYVDENVQMLNSFFCRLNLILSEKGVAPAGETFFRSMPLEATYLAWVDCTALCSRLGMDVDGLCRSLLQKEKVYFSSGTLYGKEGEGFVRINMACPRLILGDALNRLEHFVLDSF